MNAFSLCALILGGLLAVPGIAVPAQGQLEKRATTCRSILVNAEDSCDSVAARCGITAADLAAFNSNPSICSSLPVGKPVSCSAEGELTLPPTPNDDGLCYSYVVQRGDNCESMSKGYGITVDQLESFNSRTWRWKGCQESLMGEFICLSPGEPPMPVALPNAVCGPQVPGAMRPSDWSQIASVNPCPPGECCSLYGGSCVQGIDSCTSPKAVAKPTTAETTVILPSVIPVPAPPGLKVSTAPVERALAVSSTETRRIPVDLNAPTQTTTDIAPAQTSNAWMIVAYDGLGCEGDYFVLQGHNEDQGDCLQFKGEFPTDDVNAGPWCRWYTDGGASSKSCNLASKTPKSWIVHNGTCEVFYTRQCQASDPFVFSYSPKDGCADIESVVNMPGKWWHSVRCEYAT